jgi:hypothetical protein
LSTAVCSGIRSPKWGFAIVLGVWVLFLKKWKIFGLADAVMDCGDHLSVRKGKVEQIIPFSSISNVSASSMFNVNRVKVAVEAQTKPWRVIEFVPETLSQSKLVNAPSRERFGGAS